MILIFAGMKHSDIFLKRTYCLILLSLLTLSIDYSLNAQTIHEVSINWKSPSVTNKENKETPIPNFEGLTFHDGKFYFQQMEEVGAKFNASFEIVDYQTANASNNETIFFKENNIEIPSQLEWYGNVTNGAGKRFKLIAVFPFVQENGTIKKIVSFRYKQTSETYVTNYKAKSFATESVLRPGSGQWYKISVTQDGIYKIDRSFLSSMGINVANLNPQHINIYGNGDGLIPVLNSAPRTDDLALNDILVVGESDGSFDEGDYILFYARGPHRWDLNPAGDAFINERNLYSDVSCYFININPNATPARIQTQASSPLATTNIVNSYSHRVVHENDLINLTKSGQRWYGELFDVELTRNFNFSVPNPVPNSPSRLVISMASNSSSSSNGTIHYNVNGALLNSHPVPSSTYYGRSNQTINFTNTSSTIATSITLQRNNPSIVAYLDKIELNTRRQLVFVSTQFGFRDLESVGQNNISEFTIQNFPSNGFVWDVTDRKHPKIVLGNLNGNEFSFKVNTEILREFVASNGSNFFTPTYIGTVNHQNLHALTQVDYIIISPTEFLTEANRLANLHRQQNNLSVHVVDLNLIYNEFSSGSPDAGAIRTFLKMFYDRSTSPNDQIKYVCLFGDGSYDPKNRIPNNNNYIPTYQLTGSPGAESSISNIVADDFYGILDDNESMDINSIVDIGIGRLLISSNTMATEQINKIEHYMKNGSTFFAANNVNCIDGVSTSTYGDWRTRMINVGDFEDYFVNTDLEPVYNYLKANHPEININKLYLDAYQVEATVTGNRFPSINEALMHGFNSGSLLINYVGHGGVEQLSEARIITTSIIQELKNIDRLPVFVSATCEFTRFDNPELVSAGEWMTINPNGGAIAMMTTTRTVTYTINSKIIDAFFKNVFKRNADNRPRTFGEIAMHTKVTLNSNAGTDRTAFLLIGDPALRIALPTYKIVIDSINGKNPATTVDTIKALTRVTVKAHIEDLQGNILTNYNGIATPSLYDKPKQLQTLGQNPGPSFTNANVNPYELQKNVIYRGQSTVTNGHFTFEFIVPKDIDYSYGNGKFSLYAQSNTQTDCIGEDQRITIGGVNPNGLNDDIGPQINLFLNNENFVSGGITDETPYLIAKVIDESGINTVGNGIGHDITAIIDEKTSNPIVLNDYFKNDLDSYQSGEIRYQLSKLTPGRHTLTLKVWDVNNNSSQETIEFIVQEKSSLTLDHVLNYPNPFTTNTQFFFEHNQCCTQLEAQIQIFTVSGRLVKTINQQIFTQGYRSEGIVWDGKDDFGDELARGVYVYRLKVRTPDGEVAEKLEKLVLL